MESAVLSTIPLRRVNHYLFWVFDKLFPFQVVHHLGWHDGESELLKLSPPNLLVLCAKRSVHFDLYAKWIDSVPLIFCYH